MKVCGDFFLLTFFVVYDLIWLFVTFVELLGLIYAFFSVCEIIWLFMLSYRTLMWNAHVLGMKRNAHMMGMMWNAHMLGMICLFYASTLACVKSLAVGYWIIKSLSFSPKILNPTLLILVESDISTGGRIYPTRPGCHGSGTRPVIGYVWIIRYISPRLNISTLEPMLRL
jgi:hypothetical protein